LQVFLDLDCPFSRKCFKTLYEGSVIDSYKGKPVQFLVQNVIQPWHPVGSLMHEVSLAVKSMQPSSFYPFVNCIFDAQESFSDVATENMTRGQVNEALVALAVEVGVSREALQERIALTGGGGGNAGSATTQEVKWACKYHRSRGVHITPTVFVNGLEASDISSGWTVGEWKELLDDCLAASY